MSSKSSSWIIVFGSGVAFVGSLTLLALFGQKTAPDQLAVGSALFSSGLIFISAGVYLKARALVAVQPAGSPLKQLEQSKQPRRGHCELCGQGTPVVRCKTHAWQLCATCLASHYDARSCLYVPAAAEASTRSRGPLKSRRA